MSRVSDYLAASKMEVHQTVEEYAVELNSSGVTLLEQLSKAGVEKDSVSDLVSQDDRDKLLRWLKKQHSIPRQKRKKITVVVDPLINRQWRAVANGENGSEWEVLEQFASLLIFDEPIGPELQRLVNLIVARSVVMQALPLKRRGRPVVDELDFLGMQVAQRYWYLRDSGVGYSSAVSQLAEEIHKDERHVMRMVERNKHWIGQTLEDRESKRRLQKVMVSLAVESGTFPGRYPHIRRGQEQLAALTSDDYLEHLDQLLVNEASHFNPLTKKI